MRRLRAARRAAGNGRVSAYRRVRACEKSAKRHLAFRQLCNKRQLSCAGGKGGRDELRADACGKGKKISEAEIRAYALDKRHYQGAGDYHFSAWNRHVFYNRAPAWRLCGVEAGAYSDVGQHDRHDSVGNGAFDKRCADRFRNQARFQKGDGQGFVLYRNACPRKRALPRQNGDNHGRHNDGGNGALRRKRASLRAYARVYFCYGRKKSDGARA